MATWITHLRITENLLARIEGLDAGQFALGSVAPDCGLPDENWENFTPPPAVTHFKRSDSIHKDIADLDFYRGYLADFPPQDAPRFSFRLGYFFHLITDNFWTVAIGKPTTERFPEQFAADKSFIWEVKKNWYGLDHLYVRAHPDCLYWRVFLDAEPVAPGLDFFPDHAFSVQLRHIKAYYQRTDAEIEEMIATPYIYLNQGQMDAFVTDASRDLLAIYQALWCDHRDVSSLYSAISLLAGSD